MQLSVAPSTTRRGAPTSQEQMPPAERAKIGVIAALVREQVLAKYRGGERPTERDAHFKQHGCVKARFTVPRGLAAPLHLGVFAQPKTFIAWIRYSNATGRDDREGLARGMAIKLVGVPGQKILPTETNATTQDFLLVNFPVFSIHTTADYVALQKAIVGNTLPAFYAVHPAAARITKAVASLRIGDPLLQRYFSMTPYALGAGYVKYSAIPISCADGHRLHDDRAIPPGHIDFLRAAMIDDLRERPACFSFAIQRQTNPEKMPVEDSTVVWNESSAPFTTVASISIPAQRFNSPEQQRFCDNLSYTPWHALPVHRPVGNINRIRRVVYETISALRHRLNGIERTEPTGHERFSGSPTW